MLVLALTLVLGLVRGELLVETVQGTVRGIRAEDGDYSMYLGVPYARIDEENPFGTAIPYPHYETIFEANDDSAICPQSRPGGIITGTPDCLRLHVYVPDNPSSAKLPVIVWIHGGGFTIGSAMRDHHGPKFLMRHDVVVVAVNYRLGPYGFMCLDIPEVPGNQGLKDQAIALKWVSKNIAAFGGDPDRVTLMGESAGSGSIGYHLYSKHEKMYNKVIMQSGTAFGPSFIQESDPVRPITIAAHLGFETNDVAEALAYLAKVDSRDLIIASSQLGLRYRPCVEKVFEGVEHIITNHPLNLDLPKVRNMSIVAGFASHEELGDFSGRSDEYYANLNVFKDILTQAFRYSDEFLEQENLVRHYYIGDEASSQETRFQMCDFQSDIKFNYPIQKSIMKYLENGADVYQYMFSYDGDRNLMKRRQNVNDPGAIHSDLLGYIFDVDILSEEPTAEDQLIVDRLTTMWTNFAKYGKPIPETSELLPIEWESLNGNTVDYLNIDSVLSIRRRPHNDRQAFWELFYRRNDGHLKARLDH